ncbi:hypothetical protein AURDEDRAFT_184359 [Auricularia subglabra TFB-10046 SS5]|nr:hypothetical protein AURDEDRAFT_184359 [Auricularia subglabra TFB-10046 SS5]
MKRVQQKKQKVNQAQLATGSQGSDDGVFTTDIVKKMEGELLCFYGALIILIFLSAKWDKTRKEKEGKFITILQRDVDEVLETRQRNFVSGTQKLTAMYEQFQLEYATIEDEIRQTWLQIGEVVTSLEVSSESQAALYMEVEEARAEEQLQAIAIKKAAIDAFDRQLKVTKDKLKTI